MNKFTCVLAVCGILSAGVCSAAVSPEAADIISNSGLNTRQQSALEQYAQSLDSIVNLSLTDRSAVINTNKEFMQAQQCLAEVYSIDQKPEMMRVSRRVFNAVFSNDELMKQYHRFLGQARQEGDNALPGDARACHK